MTEPRRRSGFARVERQVLPKLAEAARRKTKPWYSFFGTHNPNIPVLGDAEQIIACSYTENSIEPTVGSIDAPTLQVAIVSIMEGGIEAFQR